MEKINPRHKAFIDEYLINGMNGTKAYQSVYKGTTNPETAKVSSSRLLTIDNVKQYLQSKQEDISIKHEVTRDKIIERLNKRSNLMDEIHTLAMKDTLTKEEEDKLKRLSYIIKTSDANKSDEMLAKILGINEPDKVEHSGGIIFNMIEPTKKPK